MPLPRLRDIAPHGLYARSLLLLLVPVIFILGLMTWYYYSSHIAEVNRKLAQGIARDARLIQQTCAEGVASAEVHARLAATLDMTYTCRLLSDATPPDALRQAFPYDATLRNELASRLEGPVLAGLARKGDRLHIRFPAGGALAEIIIDRKRAFVINTHFFMVWVISFSLLMVALAIGFLNQQVRSILRLSEAARAFGRGRDLPDFRPSGAREVREAARALIGMKNRLTAFAEQRTTMLAGVSHDLRTPLTRLKLALAMMPESPDIAAARSDLDEMAAMLDAYLAFARGEEADEPVTFDLARTVREIAASAGVPVDGPDTLSLTGRPLAVRRAVSNLVSNAQKYATTCRVNLIDGPRWAEVIVDDDGPGIPADKREDAFRPFSRLDEARSQNAPGTGLGLTLARDTARGHGGDVRLATSPMGGLRAVLRLPTDAA